MQVVGNVIANKCAAVVVHGARRRGHGSESEHTCMTPATHPSTHPIIPLTHTTVTATYHSPTHLHTHSHHPKARLTYTPSRAHPPIDPIASLANNHFSPSRYAILPHSHASTASYTYPEVAHLKGTQRLHKVHGLARRVHGNLAQRAVQCKVYVEVLRVKRVILQLQLLRKRSCEKRRLLRKGAIGDVIAAEASGAVHIRTQGGRRGQV